MCGKHSQGLALSKSGVCWGLRMYSLCTRREERGEAGVQSILVQECSHPHPRVLPWLCLHHSSALPGDWQAPAWNPASLSVSAEACLLFVECTRALFLDRRLPLLVPTGLPLAVHHVIDLWASSVDPGHSRSLGYVGCNHPSCLWLPLSCSFVCDAVLLPPRTRHMASAW